MFPHLVFTFAVEIPIQLYASLEEVWELLLKFTVPRFPVGASGPMVPLARPPGTVSWIIWPRNCLVYLPEAPTITLLISRQIPLPLVYVCVWSTVVNWPDYFPTLLRDARDRQPLSVDHLYCFPSLQLRSSTGVLTSSFLSSLSHMFAVCSWATKYNNSYVEILML